MVDIIKWVNEKIINDGEKIDEEDLNEIRDFTVLWNLFELICCETRCKLPKCVNLIKIYLDNFSKDDYAEIFKYLFERYKEPSRYEKLHLSGRVDGKEIKTIFDEIIKKDISEVEKEDQLKFIMIVLYRYRNNLFHGEKDMRYIKFQKENFMLANKFLMKMIEICK